MIDADHLKLIMYHKVAWTISIKHSIELEPVYVLVNSCDKCKKVKYCIMLQTYNSNTLKK